MDKSPWSTPISVIPMESGKMGDYFVEGGKLRKAHGLGWVLAAFFLVGEMAGGGIVAVPTAVVRCQFYPGLVLLAGMALISTASAILLGKSWEILLRRFPVYRTHCRKPYAEIGYRALGPKMRKTVSACVNIGAFGASTVFFLLCAKNIRDALRVFINVDISYCLMIVILALLLFPITVLKSPNDFWPVVVGGMLSTFVAICLMAFGAFRDSTACASHHEFPSLIVSNYLYSLGTMLFTFGGHFAFPTIQHDMRKPSEFTKSAVLGFFVITLFNFTTVFLGGYVYGNSLRESMINSVQTVWIQQAVNLLITVHCLLTITLVINPLNQEIEEFFHIPHGFGWKRIGIRSSVMALVIFTALTVPNFGPLLDFFGGSTIALTSVIFPTLFYLFLAAAEKRANESRHIRSDQPLLTREMIQLTDRKTLVICCTILVFSTCAGLIASISALKSLTTTHFVTPCYLRSIFADTEEASRNASALLLSSTNCCGPAQNISRFGSTLGHCTSPDLDFYG